MRHIQIAEIRKLKLRNIVSKYRFFSVWKMVLAVVPVPLVLSIAQEHHAMDYRYLIVIFNLFLIYYRFINCNVGFMHKKLIIFLFYVLMLIVQSFIRNKNLLLFAK